MLCSPARQPHSLRVQLLSAKGLAALCFPRSRPSNTTENGHQCSGRPSRTCYFKFGQKNVQRPCRYTFAVFNNFTPSQHILKAQTGGISHSGHLRKCTWAHKCTNVMLIPNSMHVGRDCCNSFASKVGHTLDAGLQCVNGQKSCQVCCVGVSDDQDLHVRLHRTSCYLTMLSACVRARVRVRVCVCVWLQQRAQGAQQQELQ
jgi:hypothetical protein